MAILDDIKRLKIELDDADWDEIHKIVAKAKREQKDEIIRNALIEGMVGDFLMAWCPEAMEAIVQDKQKQSDEWVRLTQRKYDEKGNRVCDEQMCPSTTGVAQCVHCGKFVCNEHNYMKESRCCYDCFVAREGIDKA